MIANNPQSLRDCNEKVFATEFADLMSPTTVTRRADLLKAFHAEHGDVIFKPLDGMGGSSIFRLKKDDPNVSVIIETLTELGTKAIIAQPFIEDIRHGDKRIIMINGEPFPYALARMAQKDEIRANLAAGGIGKGIELSEHDRWICKQVGPTLKEKGLFLVGLDVIGNYLTEINVTSPTCIRELERIYKVNICGMVLDCLVEKRS